MSCTPCTCLLESVGACSVTSSSDTNQLLQLNGINMPAESCENEQQTDGSPICQCGRGMSECLIHPSTPDKWIASMQDSLAKILASLESRPDLEKALEAGFTAKSCESLAWYDRDTCSWKTYQQSFLTGWGAYSETWPRWGMTVDGSAFAHPMSALRITATGGGASQQWPTPNVPSGGRSVAHVTDWRSDRTAYHNGKKVQVGLESAVKMWPTPRARDYKGARKPETMAATGRNADTNSLPDAVEFRGEAGRLSPDWVEWLMNFPIGWCQTKNFKAGGRKSQTSDESLPDALTEPTS